MKILQLHSKSDNVVLQEKYRMRLSLKPMIRYLRRTPDNILATKEQRAIDKVEVFKLLHE